MTHASSPGASPANVLVIMGSVRANRLCPKLATWITDIARQSTGLAYEVIDLAEWPLPMDDEPGLPALGVYASAQTQAWSAKVAGADAFMFVTPQYNWGYPAALKNAIDHLHGEWRGKPLMIVTYGGHGGGKCADQLKQVAEGLDMRVIPTMPAITLARAVILGGPVAPATELADQLGPVRQALAELAGMLA